MQKEARTIIRRMISELGSQAAAARQLGVPPGTLSNYRRGKRKIPPDLIMKLGIKSKPRKPPTNWNLLYREAAIFLNERGYIYEDGAWTIGPGRHG